MIIQDIYGKKLVGFGDAVTIKLIFNRSKQFFIDSQLEILFCAENLVIQIDDHLYYAANLVIDSINFADMTYIVEGFIDLNVLFTNRNWIAISSLENEERQELEKELVLIEKSKKYNVISIEQYSDEFKINRALLFDYIVSIFFKNV